MNNKNYVREKLQSQGWLDMNIGQVIDKLSEYDIIKIRNNIAHNLPSTINIKKKDSKNIKELEAELFRGWELKKLADAKAVIEPPVTSISEVEDFIISGSYSLNTNIAANIEVKSESKKLYELYQSIFKTGSRSSATFVYELREAYDPYPAEEFYAFNARLEFKEYLKNILAKIQLEIRSLLKITTQLIQFDKRTNFRNMIQFLFKNLDDAHSYVNNSLNDLIYYLNITKYETRNYTRVN